MIHGNEFKKSVLLLIHLSWEQMGNVYFGMCELCLEHQAIQ